MLLQGQKLVGCGHMQCEKALQAEPGAAGIRQPGIPLNGPPRMLEDGAKPMMEKRTRALGLQGQGLLPLRLVVVTRVDWRQEAGPAAAR